MHIIDSIGIGGGAESIVAGSIKEMKNYEHCLVTLYRYHEEFELGNINVTSLGWKSVWSIPKTVLRLRKIIREQNPDIIHTHLFWSSVIARIVKPKKIRLVVSIHSLLGVELFKSNRFLWCVEKLLSRKQDGVIAVSKSVWEDYSKQIIYKGPHYILYNFIPDRFFNHPESLNGKSIYKKCVAIGHFKLAKNYSYLLNNFKMLSEYDIFLDIYGEGPLEAEMKKFIIDNQLQNVSIKGCCNDIAGVLPNYDVFISVSKHEGFGIAMLEAMASRVACIVSDIPTYREIAGECCFFIDINNPADLANRLPGILSDKNILDKKVESASVLAEDIGRVDNYVDKLSDIYNTVGKVEA